ncbi:hypothetical protein GCM10009761_22330 [Agromyces terreus]
MVSSLLALTAWQVLVERGAVKPGQRVLIHAGAGGVGSIAIQLAKHLGAHVATTVGAANVEFVQALGADEVIDYRSQDFEAELSGFDLVLDSLGGENLEKSLRVLKPGGIAIGIAGPPDPEFARAQGAKAIARIAVGAMSRRVRRQAKRLGVRYEFLFMHADGEQLREVARLVDQGVIRPIVAEVVSFDEIPASLVAMKASGGRRGKIVATGAEAGGS